MMSNGQSKTNNEIAKRNTREGRIVCDLFWTALLLSRNVQRAEDAILDSIRSLDQEDLCTRALLICVARLRTQFDSCTRGSTMEAALAILPPELQKVLHLSAQPRYCFVLRILRGLDVDTCSALLHLDTEDIALGVRAAVCELGAKLPSFPLISKVA